MKLSRTFADATIDSIGLVNSTTVFIGFSNGDSITMLAIHLKEAAAAAAIEYLAEDEVEEDDPFLGAA